MLVCILVLRLHCACMATVENRGERSGCVPHLQRKSLLTMYNGHNRDLATSVMSAKVRKDKLVVLLLCQGGLFNPFGDEAP